MKKLIAAVAVFLILCQPVTFAGISYKDLQLPEILFPRSSGVTNVSINESPQTPGFLSFSVKSPQGDYSVWGLVNYRQCLREIEAIQRIDAEDTNNVAAGAVDSLKDTGRGLKNLVLHPVNSVTGIGRGIGKVGEKVGDTFRTKEAGEKTSMGENFLGSTKRQLAKQLGVDVYSRNPYLQARLDKMAKARMGGRGVVAVATFFAPVGLIASAVLTVSGVNSAADQLVNDNGKPDLYRLNEKALLVLGFHKDHVMRLLNHPYYTPREQTYLRFYLEKLRNISGYRSILDAAIAAPPGLSADKVLYEAQIAADLIGTVPDASRITLISEGLVLETGDSVILITAYDFLDNSAFGKSLAEKIYRLKLKLGKKSAEIWTGGTVTAGYGGMLLLKGIKLRRLCLFNKMAVSNDQP